MLAGKKKIFAVLAAALILACSLTAFHPAAVSAEVTAGDLEVGAKDVKGVLGRTLTVPINIKNDSADWLYNLDLELVMENGLEIGSGGIAPHSVVFDGVSKEQRVFWKDVKDLAPDESYTFEVPVKILEKFKDEKGAPTGEVPFGYEIGSIFTLYGSNNSHLFYPNGGGVTQFVEFNVTPLPFTVEVNSPGKQVKGAGATADPGGDWNLFSYNIAIENNTREPSTIGSLSFLMANGIQVSNFTLSPDTNELDGEGRTLLDWGSIGLAAGGTKNITFKGAIFNKHTQGGNVNAGAVIEDGEALKSILSYSGYVNSTPDIDYLDDPESIAVAKDMIISKGVAPSSGIGYGSTLTYDLTVKTNEYYPVNNARVTDTLGDGQTFSLFSDMTVSGSVYGSVYQADPLIIVWDGGLPERSVARMTIKSTVDTEWSNGDPIVAGDRIRNGVECKGETVFESYDGEPPDSAVAVAAINKPLIDLQLLEKNGSPYTGDPAEVLVGDKLKYRLTYDASAVDARQKNVDIINFFPQGTKYVDASATFSPGWDGGALIKALALGNDHFWYNFGFIDKNKTLWVEYELEVIDDVIITDQKQACNLAKLSFENTPGVVDSEREGLSLTYGAPVLKIAKNADKTTGLVAGETVSFIITVTNDGGAPAYDVKVKDTLPLELKDITDISHGGSYDSGNGAVTYTVGSIGAKSSAVLTFKAKVADPVGAQYTMQNRAEITEYKKRSGGADYTGGSDVGLNLTTAEPAITKTVIAKSRENISMGDWVVYKISVTVPKATLYSAVVTDQKPGEHKFIELYSSYTDESNNTVYGAAYGIDGNTLTITGLGDLTGPITRDFYIKAMVNAYMASQTNTATVRWYDKETGGIQRNKQAQANVSVTQPTLTASWAGWTAKTGMKQGDSEPNTFRISNTGNTAYNFIPVITMPEELNASDFTGGTVVSNTVEDGVRTVTFQEVLSLGAGASYDIGMTISVDGVPVVGRPYAITGNTGTYYTTEGKTHSRSEASASAAITAAGMGISKTVTGSDNNGSKMEIRPGDRITYDIAVTVPKGTKAYDLRVTDTLPAELELVSSKYNGDPYTLGDVFESDSDASAEAKTYNITVVARAKTAVEYGVSSRKAEQNTAAVYWKQTVGGAESNSSSDISIDVVEPKLVIDSYTADKTAFADTGDSITFSASIKNNGQSTAHGIKVTAAIPSGMVIKEGTISAGGSIVGGNIVWTFASLDEAVSQDLSFTLSEDGDIFTPSEGSVALTINEYFSREDKGSSKKYGQVSSSKSIGQQSAISGIVFEDADGDGVKDPEEEAISGVTVTVTGSGGASHTLVTNAEGRYAVAVPAGSTAIAVASLSGSWRLTTGNASQTKNVAQGTLTYGEDVGFRKLGTVSGIVFEDKNGNGQQDAGESGIAGVKVRITESGSGMPEPDITTDANGAYSMAVPTGSTKVEILPAAGYVLTTPGKNDQTLTVNHNTETKADKSGYRAVGSVTGLVFEDADGDGIKDDSETGIAGVTVTITDMDGKVYTRTTGAGGTYTVDNIPVGTALVAVTGPEGYALTTAGKDSQTVMVGKNTVVNADNAGYKALGRIWGVIFNDANGDGVKQPGENGLSGVLLNITSSLGTVTAVTTGADGSYSQVVPLGSTGVTLAQAPAGYVLTTAAKGGTEAQTINVTNDNTPANDIGYNRRPGAVNDSYSVTAGQTLIINVPGILGNDTDAEENTLSAVSISGISDGTKGTLTANGDGSFTFQAGEDASGTVSFTYKANDGISDSTNTGTVTIYINRRPAAADDSYEVNEGETLIINAPGMLGNDTDAEGDTLSAVSISGISDGTKGTLTANGDGSFTFVSNAAGTVSFTYKANDGKADSNTATVTINIISPSGDRDDSPSKPAPSKPAPPAEPGHETVGYRSTEPDILLKTTEDKEKPFMDYSKITVELPGGGKNGQAPKITVDDTGKVEAENLQKDTNYDFNIYFELEPGINVVIGHLNVKVDKDGNVEVEKALIDPYGVLTDTISGDVVPGAYIDLRYADTQRNRDNGILPDTRVALPKLEGFEPNNNINPQYSDMDGKYAYMVYPYTDYYILVRLPGYKDFKSPVISVEAEIVKFDIDFEPSEVRDPAVFISSGRNKIQEKTNVDIVLDYMNKSITDCENAVLSLVLPEGFTVVSAYGAEISGQKITWDLGTLKVGQKGSRYITLKAPEISQGEWIVNLDAAITADGKLYFREDDTSRLPLLVYSNRYTILHKRYIKGYPDFTFRPYKSMTRAEVAAIFARIMELESTVTGDMDYKDVDGKHWAAGYIEAVSRKGLFTGYDGRFRPDQAITRAELSMVVARFLGVDRSNKTPVINLHYGDINKSFARNSIEELYRLGVVEGYGDSGFKPDNPIVRAEAVAMINRMLLRGPLTGMKNTFRDTTEKDWSFEDAEESIRTHEAQWMENGKEKMLRYIEEPLW